MAQVYATLLFLLVAAAGVTVIAASLIDDWALMVRALGFGGTNGLAPLPHGRTPNSRQPRAVRIIRRSDDRRVAA